MEEIDVFIADLPESGQQTAKKALDILVNKDIGFVVLTPKQRRNLLVAFARKGKAVYGRAFDLVRLSEPVDLDDEREVQRKLKSIIVFEVKSTRRKVKKAFSGYFFSISAAEILVAQSLKGQFRIALVDTTTSEHEELTLNEVFGRARGIYPSWSIAL